MGIKVQNSDLDDPALTCTVLQFIGDDISVRNEGNGVVTVCYMDLDENECDVD